MWLVLSQAVGRAGLSGRRGAVLRLAENSASFWAKGSDESASQLEGKPYVGWREPRRLCRKSSEDFGQKCCPTSILSFMHFRGQYSGDYLDLGPKVEKSKILPNIGS